MPNEPLNFRITATDEASAVVQRVDAETDALADKVVNVNIGVTGGDSGALAGEAADTAASLTAVEEAVSNMATTVSDALVALDGVASGLVTVEEASAATAAALEAVDATMAVLGPESGLAAAAAAELSAALTQVQAAAAAAAEETQILEESAAGAGAGLDFADRASTTGIRDLYRIGVIANSAGVQFAGLSTRVITSAVALAAFSNLGFLNAAAITGGLYALGAVFSAIKGGTDEAAASAKDLTKAYEDLANVLPKSSDAAGALNEHLRSMLISSPDLAKALVDLGTNGGGLADAIQGGVNPAIDTARQFMKDYGDSVAAARAAGDDLSKSQQQLADKYGIASTAVEKRLVDSEKLVHTADAESRANQDATDKTNTFAKAAQGLSTVASDVAAAGADWAKSNREVDVSLNPDLWNRVADAARDLALGQTLTAEQTAAVLNAMADYGLTSDQVLTEGKKLWKDNAKAAEDAAKATADAAKKSGGAFGKLADDVDNLKDKYADLDSEAKVLGETLKDQEDAGFSVHTAFGDASDALITFGDDIKKLVPDMKSQAAVWDRQNKSTELAGTHLTTYTEAGRKALNATKDLAGAVDTELTQAFINASGSQQGFLDAGHDLAARVAEALKTAGVAKDEIPNFVQMLGLTDDQLTLRFHIAEATDALSLLQNIVADLQGDLDQDPAFKLQLRAAMQAKDPVEGLGELIQHYKDNPPVLSALLDLTSGLPPDLQAQINQWLTDHGVTVTYPSKVDAPAAPPDPPQPGPDQAVVYPVEFQPVTGQALELPPGVDLTGTSSAIPINFAPGVKPEDAKAAFSEIEAATKDPATGKDAQATIDVHADTAGALKTIDDFVKAQNGRVVVIRVVTQEVVGGGPNGTPGPPAPTTPSRVVVNQTINAGFGTDRFALERAVRDANHKLNRLAGVRA